MEDLAEWTAMQKHLARVLQSDPVIHNPERIMRLPGFLNVKGEPVPCEIVECDPLRRYSLEQIRSVIGGVDIEPGRHTPAPPVPESIVEGSRNATLASIAGTMQRRGLSEQAIIAALKEENKTKCQPPLPDSEVEAIARSIARYDPAPTIEPLTDIGNANRFVKSHGANTRFCHKRGAWLCWTGTRWEWDEGERTLTLAKQTALNIFDEAKNAN
jgi:hypothetical protein